MAGGPSVALLRDMQTLFDGGTVAGLSDRQLLDRFLHARDGTSEAAFEVLVRRHGPMVLRVCRNVLKDWNDAEDAFQATFLILARRCGSIRRRDSVESWLFGVACRVAARARVEAARRRAVERRGAQEADAALGDPTPDDPVSPELGPIVQEEVRRLPEKYRRALVLCYWEGLTHEQAAAQLGCPLGTVRSRIARGRDILRRRLTRRGVAPMAGLAASGFDFATVVPIPAAVPDTWVAETVQAVARFASGSAPITAAAKSAAVSTLVRDVLRSLIIMKLKMAAICLSLIGIGAAGVILAAPQRGPEPTPKAASQESRPERKDAPDPAAKKEPALLPMENYVVEPPDMILVELLEALPGRPISGERLVRPDGKISLGFYGDVPVAGLTLPQIKERIVLHFRKFISDDILGLVERDMDTGDFKRDKDGRVIVKDPRETDRVFVNITVYNSKNFYVQGEVRSPGRIPITGHDNILDAIYYCDGLTPRADHAGVVLYRKGKDGSLQRLPINIDQILMGDDPTTNYQLLPGDRLVIPARPGVAQDEDSREDGPATDLARSARDEKSRGRPALHDLERRLGAVERKLDRILQALERRGDR